MNSLEERHQKELRELQSTVSRLCDRLDSSTKSGREVSLSNDELLAGNRAKDTDSFDIVRSGTVTEDEWAKLYNFFDEHCRTVIAFMDDQLYSAAHVIRKQPLMATVICVIASKAVHREKYTTYLVAADQMIGTTFSGAIDLYTVQAMMLLAAWTGRHRLWGYVASIAAELGLNVAALHLGDVSVEHTADLVGSARTWLSLCCFDLMINLDRPFVIYNIMDYLPVASQLLVSPHCRPVDYRLCAYLQGFSITAEAKTQIANAELRLNPLSDSAVQKLRALDQKIDRWFYHINNSMEPLYQTFAKKQDRNRFMVPYAFLKMYVSWPYLKAAVSHGFVEFSHVNGLALHVKESQHGSADTNRMAFVQKALDSACLLLQTQFESKEFRQMLPYSGDYNLVTTYYALEFMPRALEFARGAVNCGLVLSRLRQGAQLLEEAGAAESANSVRSELRVLEQVVRTSLPPEGLVAEMDQAAGESLFDIPNLLDI
ncbi:hypothetical protein ASPACDRAFT_45682 [Aspergillus aculeatus ATCC 16872]|uniref:Transcription factor domain-containing protein n=1 Tax=Aspergillus aculeatus (strain ATCC 16872 / CBS 172.66 / WB 5094) TaxID=690307 RepID=A0A1L9WN82_ASPA1|nr:uncharacterized protein ASPACDRAFT_45682 [Aspergillus aculeatus ATCC 16872]OJJ97590.1 hypothetical protein ASPACDRAFT_45682 [Aspergillus aculeatus ATCC 16872]